MPMLTSRCSVRRLGALVALVVAPTVVAHADVHVRVLYDFAVDSGHVKSPPVQGVDGSFYGTTYAGGQFGFGSFYKVTSSGSFTQLHSFNGVEGGGPSQVIRATDGNFYGITAYGGLQPYPPEGSPLGPGYGNGTVVRITPSGSVTVLHVFLWEEGYAQRVDSALVQGNDGALYGTTSRVAFRITLAGGMNVLHDFYGDIWTGTAPSTLTQASDGNFYGVTTDTVNGFSDTVAYRMSPAGAITVLHYFNGNEWATSLGASPLIESDDGYLYGSTSGPDGSAPTVFRMSLDGSTFLTLHTFAAVGCYPSALIKGTDGNLYGTTTYGGSTNLGTLFRVSASGTFTTVHAFAPEDGTRPLAWPYRSALVQAADGSLWGTTGYDGQYGVGTLFSVDLGRPLKITSPADGAAPQSNFIALTGTGPSGDNLDVLVNDQVVGTIAVDTTGTWEALPYIAGFGETVTIQVRDQTTADSSNRLTVKAAAIRSSGPWLTPERSYLPLRHADILIGAIPSSIQATLYGANYTHAAIYLGGDVDGTPWIAEAVTSAEASYWGQVRSVLLEQSLLWTGERISAFTPTTPLSSDTRDAIVNWSNSITIKGLPYWDLVLDFGLILRAAGEFPVEPELSNDGLVQLNALKHSVSKFICSTLVWRAYWEGTGGKLDISAPNNMSATAGSVLAFMPALFLSELADVFVVPETFVRSPKLKQIAGTVVASPPVITSDTNSLNFGAMGTGAGFVTTTPAQVIHLAQAGSGLVTWTAYSDQPWLHVTPQSGTAPATFSVSVSFDASLQAATATGSVAIQLTGTSDTVAPIAVTLRIMPSTGPASRPFGVFETPTGDAPVAGSVAMTGWTLDNVGVKRVELWRDLQPGETTPPFASTPSDPRNGKVFISNATFVEGARPDVEALYPTTPFNYRAGWGYLLLTWGLWNQGNGTYKLYAFAFDQEDNVATIGSKSIVVNNNAAKVPFGSIDTPGIGGDPGVTPNFGWGLTPKVNGIATCKIPSTGVQVSIDSGPLQPVTYGDVRGDIAGAFAGFSNSAAAGGHYIFDWTTLTNGTHTIGWLITDDCNRADGVGSRFFNVTTETNVLAAPSVVVGPTGAGAPLRESDAAITVARGFDEIPLVIDPGLGGSRTIEMRQGERIEIRVPHGFDHVWQLGPNGQQRPLPTGSTWGRDDGILYWQPFAGFLGRFRIVFSDGHQRINVRVVVLP